MNNKISVIIPIYNMERYLHESIDSVLKQTLDGVEIICVDDGSTDESLNILEQYQKTHKNIQVFHQERKGSGSARNLGINKAKSEFVAFLDADDYYPNPNALEMLYVAATTNGLKAAGGSAYMFRDDKYRATIEFGNNRKKSVFLDDGPFDFKDYQYPYGYTRFIYQHDMLIDNNIFFPDYARNQDPIFMARALEAAGTIWGARKDVYAIRVTDKHLDYCGEKVIMDVIKGHYDLTVFAHQFDYDEMKRLVVNELIGWKTKYLAHVASGNNQVLEYLHKMDEYLKQYANVEGYYLGWTYKEVRKYVDNYKAYAERIKNAVNSAERIIIYGAGVIGREAFSFVQENNSSAFCGTAISDGRENESLKGRDAKGISEYIEYCEESLVLVAAKKTSIDEMERTAKSLGFKNVLAISEPIIDFGEIGNGDTFAI